MTELNLVHWAYYQGGPNDCAKQRFGGDPGEGMRVAMFRESPIVLSAGAKAQTEEQRYATAVYRRIGSIQIGKGVFHTYVFTNVEAEVVNDPVSAG